ncbi:dihydrolipoyl dehydrogenase [Pelagimonas sp. KU-00592-HH]|uniref:dihydrolipoyl dehydrogenase n=1 Tax=Roseobacteraceae TaxID=2854170 RepID=UPI0020CCC9DF|nr:dihydrolipoyl dehydrogenase [Shimia sp. CNT1-13L.2]MCP9480591.1 dihydrolipoyl dehydrogenase [Shimia sp. CNT1-13L.2]
MSQYDVIIIGAGPGGYVSAIRCAQLGLKTAVVEGRETLGGTCLNVGCIPSKALLHATHLLHEAEHNFANLGLKGKSPSVDWDQMKSYKSDVVGQNTGGIEFLFKKNKIDWIKGYGTIEAAGKVKVGDTTYETKNIVIASGSVPASLPGVEVDNDKGIVVDSTGALDLPKVPKKMVVIGAGVIGLELGSVYARLGAEVTVVEYMDAVCPGMDADVQRSFKRILEKQGLKFIMGAAVQGVDTTKTKAKVKYQPKKGGDEEVLDADVVLVATGRKPYYEGLGLDTVGVALTERGQVAVDGQWRTNVPGIYAIGDVIEGPMLAHKAEDEGMAVAEVMAGKHGHVNYGVIPGVVYTTPEVATVGATEASLKAEGRKVKVGKFMFMGNARAKAVGQAEGAFAKIIVDAETDRVLGAAIIGPSAGDMIHEICVAMEFGASAQDIALTCHAHPTYSEAVREAALACGDGPIHS